MRALHIARLSFVLALVGCPGPTFVVQQYNGPPRDREAIATFRVNASDNVVLVALDDEDLGVPLERDSRLHIELLPGRHTVGVRNANAPQAPVDALAFQAEAGKVYRAAYAPSARVFEVERGADTTVRDVTIAPGEAPVEAPRQRRRLPPVAPPPAETDAPLQDDAGLGM